MKIKKNHRLPLLMICISLSFCLVLALLPVKEIVVTYSVVNGIKTVEFVSKTEGIFIMISISLIMNCLWIFARNRIDRKPPNGPGLFFVFSNKWMMNLWFFVICSVPAIMGIISLILWMCDI